jgi:hypothetical protein
MLSFLSGNYNLLNKLTTLYSIINVKYKKYSYENYSSDSYS